MDCDGGDKFWRILAISLAVHLIVILVLPRPVSSESSTLVIRALTFLHKDILDPVETNTASRKPDVENVTSLNRLTRAEITEISVTPEFQSDKKRPLVPEKKLTFVDKLQRRPGGKTKKSPQFLEHVRKLISKSCEEHVSNKVSIPGLERIVVLSVTILPSGEVASVRIVKSSTIPMLDRASAEAVKMAGPFPKFPSDLDLPHLKLRVPIRYVLSRNM